MITCADFMNDLEYLPNEALLILNNKIEPMAHTDWIEIMNDGFVKEAYNIKEVKFIIPIIEYKDTITISVSRYDNGKSLPGSYTNLEHIISTLENIGKDNVYYDDSNCYVTIPYYFFQLENCSSCSIYTTLNKIKIFIKRYECNRQLKISTHWFLTQYFVYGWLNFSGYILGIFIQTTNEGRNWHNNGYEDNKYRVVLEYDNIKKEVLLNKINKSNKLGTYTYFLNLNVLTYKQAVNPKNYKHYYKNREHLIKWTDLSIHFTKYCTVNKIAIMEN